MTKTEAIYEMEQGRKVTHIYFTRDEWVIINDKGLFEFEDGVSMQRWLFWAHRKDEPWQEGWSLFEENLPLNEK
jgi:hypothetical protein